MLFDRSKIEITNVEDMKDVANDFDMPNFSNTMASKKQREQKYLQNRATVKNDLELLKSEIIDRDNLNKLKDTLEFLQKNEINYSLLSDKANKDIVVDILDNINDDLDNTSVGEDYNLVREIIKFLTFLEENMGYSKFFEIYNASKNLKKKAKEKESNLLNKVKNIVLTKQKKRKIEINKKKKQLNEEMMRECCKINTTKTNAILEDDYIQKKEEELFGKRRKHEPIDLVYIQPEYLLLDGANVLKQEIKIEEKIKYEAKDSKNKANTKDLIEMEDKNEV
jgi:hypothetical protein